MTGFPPFLGRFTPFAQSPKRAMIKA
jgi:hypothetical protein